MNYDIRLIQSIQRAIDIINCFSQYKPTLSINEISKELSLHINTTRGIINTLVYNGYLRHDPIENKYSLGLVFIPKAELVNTNSVDRIKEIVRPYLYEIANKYEVSSRLQLISRQKIFTVDTVNPENSRYILLTRMDTPFPINATSSGKLYLYYTNEEEREKHLNNISQVKYTDKTIISRNDLEKELEFIRLNGYSIENEEIGLGISSIAIPLFNHMDTFFGTISVTATISIIEKVHDKVLIDMKRASEEIKKARF